MFKHRGFLKRRWRLDPSTQINASIVWQDLQCTLQTWYCHHDWTTSNIVLDDLFGGKNSLSIGLQGFTEKCNTCQVFSFLNEGMVIGTCPLFEPIISSSITSLAQSQNSMICSWLPILLTILKNSLFAWSSGDSILQVFLLQIDKKMTSFETSKSFKTKHWIVFVLILIFLYDLDRIVTKKRSFYFIASLLDSEHLS